MKPITYRIVALGFFALTISYHAGSEPLIAIDVGHSKLQPGSISARGIPEFEFNATLARTIHDNLSSRHVSSVLIGENGTIASIEARTTRANERGSTFFLSVHHDSAQPKYLETWTWQERKQRHSERFSGFSLFVSRKNPFASNSLECARKIGLALKAAGFKPTAHHAEPIPGENREWADENNGVYFFDDLVVLKTATTPALLLEAGVIINRDEEITIQQSATRNTIATAVIQGLSDCNSIP